MKITSLKIKNIGLIADETIEINRPLIIFYGEIRNGKTTFLNAVRWVCGGAFPDDIIRHGEKEALIELGFDGGVISREFYRSKDGKTVKAREVQFVRDGKPVGSPVGEIKRFLNPFLLDQDYLKKMGDTDRKRFFTDFFAVDTVALDKEAFNVDREATRLRSEIKGYGEIALTPVEKADPSKLREELQAVRRAHAEASKEVETENMAASRINVEIKQRRLDVEEWGSKLTALEKQIAQFKKSIADNTQWLAEHPEPVLKPLPTAPDTSALEDSISNAAAQNVRHEQFLKDKARLDEKTAKAAELATKETRLREIKKEKIAKLESITKDCKIKGLAFDEAGNFTYESTDAGMLSTSQLMKLSSELSALYPEGFGLELLDRGESLGRSIFEFIERAKAEDKSILATIVGEAPAKVPADVGVFVVEKGKATKKAPAVETQPELG